jgi:polysaccharide export outer membrane protein
MNPIFKLFLLIYVCGYVTACKSSRKLTEESIYFKNISDSLLSKQTIEYEPVLQKGDILSIVVVTPNENSSKLFNRPNASEGAINSDGGSSGSGGGYLVDENGAISIPYIGNVKAAGLTRKALTDSLTEKLKQYIESATVTVRLLNYRITVLGEVAKPGTYVIPSERVSILDAIGLAGDLTVYGKRNNIRIIRQTDDGRKTGTVDINKGDIFGSPYYYLRQNDVVYVEMNNRKIPGTDQSSLRGLGVALGIISAIGVIVSTINVLSN